jgi:hypothetical protein
MADLIEHGAVAEWGIAESEDSALMLNSLDLTTSITGEQEFKNRFGQVYGWLGYDQQQTFNMSGYLIEGGSLTYTLASSVALNNFAGNNDFVTGMGAGATASDKTSIVTEIKRTLSNESAVQVDISGKTYNFASVAAGA